MKQLIKQIFDEVKNRGDQALIDYTAQFDKIPNHKIKLEAQDLRKRIEGFDFRELKKVIRNTKFRIESFHKNTQLNEFRYVTAEGVLIHQMVFPLEKIGLYIPGGKFPLISTLMMLLIPARIAGVKEICICTPPSKDGKIDPKLAFVLNELGVEQVFLIGGAQAVAAMAVGTESVPRVSKIFGPGNQYVNEAKKFCQTLDHPVAIDLMAGPSEVAIYLDRPDFISKAFVEAQAQIEHGPDSSAYLLIENNLFLDSKVEIQSLIDKAGLQLLISKVDGISDLESQLKEIGPEHFVSYTEKNILSCLNFVGAHYDGRTLSAAMGDYGIGPNHTLPTNKASYFSSGLSVRDFQRTVASSTRINEEKTSSQFDQCLEDMILLAECEGLISHKEALKSYRKNISFNEKPMEVLNEQK